MHIALKRFAMCSMYLAGWTWGLCALQIHWFSIINSCVTVLLLTGFLATILMRVLKNDFVKYTRDDEGGSPLLACLTPPVAACVLQQQCGSVCTCHQQQQRERCLHQHTSLLCSLAPQTCH